MRVIRVLSREFCEEGVKYKYVSVGILVGILGSYVVSPVPQRMHCMERSDQAKVPSTGNEISNAISTKCDTKISLLVQMLADHLKFKCVCIIILDTEID